MQQVTPNKRVKRLKRDEGVGSDSVKYTQMRWSILKCRQERGDVIDCRLDSLISLSGVGLISPPFLDISV